MYNIKTLKDYLQSINWMNVFHHSLLLLCILYINFYLISFNLQPELFEIAIPPIESARTIGFLLLIPATLLFSVYLAKNRNRKFIFLLILSYLLCLLVSYFISATQNINNIDFNVWNFQGNGFLQKQTLPIIIGLIGGVLLAWYGGSKLPIEKWILVGYKESNFPAILAITTFILNDRLLMPIYTNSLYLVASDKNFFLYFVILITILWIFVAAVGSMIGLILSAVRSVRSKIPSLAVAFVTSLFLAIIFNYTLQYGVKADGDLIGYFVLPGATSYQIILLTIINFLLYLLFNRYIAVSIGIIILGTSLSISNLLKDAVRSEPLLITDFVWLKNVKLLLTFVDATTISYAIVVLSFLIGIYVYMRRFFAGPISKNVKLRGALIVSILVFLGSIYIVFKNEEDKEINPNIPIISTLNNSIDINYQGFRMNAAYKSLMFVWTKQLTKNIMDKPVNYSEEMINDVLDKYTKLATSINETRLEDISNQTIIYVLSESFADPGRLDGVHVSQDVIPNIHQFMSETTSGTMLSNGYGGGTANMEFQTLTGLPYTNFSSSVSTLYTEVVPKMSVFPSISDLFEAKNRIVIHPSDAANYSRKYIYDKLNFSTFIATSGGDKTLTNPVERGINVSDESVYDNLLENIDVSQSQFFSVITMQNHMPWSENTPIEVIAEGDGFSEQSNSDLTSYARLLTYTDLATKELLEQLSQLDKNITLVFYGDHLPGFYSNSVFKTNPLSQYETDYFIWSNNSSTKMSYSTVGANDFIAALFEHTNSKISPYYALLTEYLNKANISSGELSEEQQEIDNDLKLVQYDITVGKGYLKKHPTFFEIRK